VEVLIKGTYNCIPIYAEYKAFMTKTSTIERKKMSRQGSGELDCKHQIKRTTR
jgi:hypothetical protein